MQVKASLVHRKTRTSIGTNNKILVVVRREVGRLRTHAKTGDANTHATRMLAAGTRTKQSARKARRRLQNGIPAIKVSIMARAAPG